MGIPGIHHDFTQYVLAGSGFCALFALVGCIGGIGCLVNMYRHHLALKAGALKKESSPVRKSLLLVVMLLLVFVGIFGSYKIYADFHRASMLIIHARPYPALITSILRQESTTSGRSNQRSHVNIIYVTITSRDRSHKFPEFSDYRVDTGVDTGVDAWRKDPRWRNSTCDAYIDDSITHDEVVFRVNGQFWYAKKSNEDLSSPPDND